MHYMYDNKTIKVGASNAKFASKQKLAHAGQTTTNQQFSFALNGAYKALGCCKFEPNNKFWLIKTGLYEFQFWITKIMLYNSYDEQGQWQ